MKRKRWAAAIFAVALVGAVPSKSLADRELFRAIPGDVGACLIVNDLSGAYREIRQSKLAARVAETSLFQQFVSSPPYAKLVQVWTLAPFFLGISGEELRDDVLGESFALVFRPGGDAEKGSGVFLCQAVDSEVLNRLVATLTQEQGGRVREDRRRRGVDYVRRQDPNGKVAFVLQMESVAAISDSEQAIHDVIDARLDDASLGAEDRFVAARKALPVGSFLELYVNPRPFDSAMRAALKPSNPVERLMAGQILETWDALQWLALTVRFEQGIKFGLHWELDRPVSETEPDGRLTEFWQRIPSDALAAAAFSIDAPSLAGLIETLIRKSPDEEVRTVGAVFQQLLPGYDLRADVVPRIGPLAGVAVLTGEDRLLDAIGAVQLQPDPAPGDGSNRGAGSLPLALALEFTLRPALVFIGLEHNREQDDTLQAKAATRNGARIHYLHGSRIFPAWLQPGFCVHDRHFVVGTSPDAIAAWLSPPKETMLDRLGPESVADGARLHAALDIRGAVALLRENKEAVQNVFANESAASDPTDSLKKFSNFLDVLEVFDTASLTSRTQGAVRHAQLALTVGDKVSVSRQ